MGSSNLKEVLARHGDLLSPFLFVLVGEVLSRMIGSAGHNDRIKGVNYLKTMNQLLIYNLLMIYLYFPMQGRWMQMASWSVLILSQHGRVKR